MQRPELDQERFVNIPQCEGIFYRSGDWVRMLANGELVFVGRVDDQVSIRGYRIELGEIEKQLTQQAGVSSAVVLAHPMANGQPQLVAFVKHHAASDNSLHTLKANLSHALPSYMVPTFMLNVEHWPLTPGGKVDKRALAALFVDSEHTHSANANLNSHQQTPRVGTEQILATCWANVLGLGETRISREDDFFLLGGHSILAIKLLASINSTFAIQLTLRDLYQQASLQQMYC